MKPSLHVWNWIKAVDLNVSNHLGQRIVDQQFSHNCLTPLQLLGWFKGLDTALKPLNRPVFRAYRHSCETIHDFKKWPTVRYLRLITYPLNRLYRQECINKILKANAQGQAYPKLQIRVSLIVHSCVLSVPWMMVWAFTCKAELSSGQSSRIYLLREAFGVIVAGDFHILRSTAAAKARKVHALLPLIKQF